jgi:hypothetical protein
MKRTISIVGAVLCGFVIGAVAGRITPVKAQYGTQGKVYIDKDTSPGFGSGSVPVTIQGSQIVGFSCVATGSNGEDQTCFVASVK